MLQYFVALSHYPATAWSFYFEVTIAIGKRIRLMAHQRSHSVSQKAAFNNVKYVRYINTVKFQETACLAVRHIQIHWQHFIISSCCSVTYSLMQPEQNSQQVELLLLQWIPRRLEEMRGARQLLFFGCEIRHDIRDALGFFRDFISLCSKASVTSFLTSMDNHFRHLL